MVRVLGPTEYKVVARLIRARKRAPLRSSSRPPPACRRARSCQGMASQERSILKGWGDTDSTRITVSDAQVGTKKRALRSNQENRRRKAGELLDKENPIQGPWCRFRREARA